MANTTNSTREQVSDAIERGEFVSPSDIVDLLKDAEQYERMENAIESIRDALATAGLVLIDVTTDDDDEIVYEITEAEDAH